MDHIRGLYKLGRLKR